MPSADLMTDSVGNVINPGVSHPVRETKCLTSKFPVKSGKNECSYNDTGIILQPLPTGQGAIRPYKPGVRAQPVRLHSLNWGLVLVRILVSREILYS